MATSNFERRFLPTEFEVRAEGNTLTIEGYALKWDARSGNLGGFKERVSEGATKKTIKESDIRALINHDPNLILGRSKAGKGTLELSNDETGTYYRVTGDIRQSYVQDLAIAMERGDVNQSSFGFRVVGPEGQEWSEDEDGYPLRTLREIQLFDVSPVTYPAYEDSTSGLGKRALETLAESRGLSLEVVENNLIAVIRDEIEPDTRSDESVGETTHSLITPDQFRDLEAREIALKAMLLRLS
jgi:HK97 family phage prohead protease